MFAIFDYFSECCSTFGTLHFEKSSNTAKSLEKMKKILSIIPLLKWSLLEPKMFIVQSLDKYQSFMTGIIQCSLILLCDTYTKVIWNEYCKSIDPIQNQNKTKISF